MAAKLYFNAFIPAFSNLGVPFGNSKLYFYYTATTTFAPIYADAGLTTPLPNPVAADIVGKYPDIYLDETVTYRVQQKTALGADIGDAVDPYIPGTAVQGLKGDPGSAGDGYGTLAELAAAGNTATNLDDASLVETGKEGKFVFRTGDQSANVSADTLKGIWVAKSSDPTGATGAWKRVVVEGVNVRWFGADASGISDSRAAFTAAFALAGQGGTVIIPPGTYLISDVIKPLTKQTLMCYGAVLTHNNDQRTIMWLDTLDNFSILGRLFFKGLLTVNDPQPETGLRISNCTNYRIEGVQADNFKGKGIWLDGSTSGPLRGNRGHFVDCIANRCQVGLQIDAGAGAEYNTWVNFTAGGNITGASVSAGNNVFLGGNFVDNNNGVYLGGGPNHAHGMFVGTNINHNSLFNLHCENIVNGMTFSHCHFYQGNIWLNDCQRIVIDGGDMDINTFYNWGGPNEGYNWIKNVHFPAGNYGIDGGLRVDAVGGTAKPELLIIRDCTGKTITNTGVALNDPADVWAFGQRDSASTQALTSGVPANLTFPVLPQNGNRRKNWNNATGVFTVPATHSGQYRIKGHLSFSGTAMNQSLSYVKMVTTGTESSMFFPSIAYSTTKLVVPIDVSIYLTAGDTVKFQGVITGTTPVFGDPAFSSFIEFEKIT